MIYHARAQHKFSPETCTCGYCKEGEEEEEEVEEEKRREKLISMDIHSLFPSMPREK